MPVNNAKKTSGKNISKQSQTQQESPAADSTSGSRTKLPWIGLLKLLCGVALVSVLFWQASAADGFERLKWEETHLGWFAASIGLITCCLFFGSLRWQFCAHATAMPLKLSEAFRWSAIGFASSLVSLGNTGGDVVKATLLARKRPGQMTTAVSTIFVDRMIGLLIMLLFASGAILMSGILTSVEAGESIAGTQTVEESLIPKEGMKLLCRSALVVTAIAIGCFLTVLSPGKPLVRLANLFKGVPLIGPLLVKAALLCDNYQRGWRWLLASVGVGLIDNALLVSSFYAIAMALPLPSPGLLQHYFIVPFAFIAGALPISPSGLGTFEAAVELLYQGVGNDSIAKGDGTFVAFGHRIVMLLTAGLATVYFFATKPSIETIEVETADSESPKAVTSPAG